VGLEKQRGSPRRGHLGRHFVPAAGQGVCKGRVGGFAGALLQLNQAGRYAFPCGIVGGRVERGHQRIDFVLEPTQRGHGRTLAGVHPMAIAQLGQDVFAGSKGVDAHLAQGRLHAGFLMLERRRHEGVAVLPYERGFRVLHRVPPLGRGLFIQDAGHQQVQLSAGSRWAAALRSRRSGDACLLAFMSGRHVHHHGCSLG